MDYQKAISNCRTMLSFLRADRGEQIKTRQINRIEEDTLKTAISAMEELEQYKQLGTLEDIKNLQSMEICNFEQLKRYREIGSVREFRECKEILGKAYANELATVIDEYAEYRKLGTLEEVRAAVDKQNAIKIIKAYDSDINLHWCSCGNCAKGLGWETNLKSKYCPECGQKLDWSEEE